MYSNTLSHNKETNLPIPLDLPAQIHALAANKSEDFIILDNHGNPFVSSDNNILDASSVDTKSVEEETVDGDKNDNDTVVKNKNSENSSDFEDSSSDDESENSGVSDRCPQKEEMSGMRGNLPNLPPPRVSHRSGLRQPRQVNYTHTTINHTNNNSNRRSTSNSKSETMLPKQQTNKHKSHKQENPYYDHNSNHDKKLKRFLNAIASFNNKINEIIYFINHIVLPQYGMRKGLQVFGDRRLASIKKEIQTVPRS